MEERKNTEKDEITYDKIAFETEDGVEEYFILEETKLQGVNYLAVTDDIDSEDGEFLILKEIANDDDDVLYEIVDDDNELQSVITLFDNLIDDFDLDLEV